MSNPSIRQSGPASRVRVPLIGALLLAGLAVAGTTWPAVLQSPLPATLAALATPSASLLAPAAGTAVAVLVLAGLLVRRARRARRERRQRAALASFDGLHVCGAVQARKAVAAGDNTDDRPDRVLRLRVRILEQALEGQDERLAEAVQQGQRRAMVTLAALRQSLAHERGEVALARVEAALCRIGTAPSFARPTLTTGPSGMPPVAFAAVQLLVADLADATATAQSTAATADTGTAVTADVDRAGAVDDIAVADLGGDAAATTEAPVPPVPRVVRPVPAPVRREAPHRSRRRLRRTVAA